MYVCTHTHICICKIDRLAPFVKKIFFSHLTASASLAKMNLPIGMCYPELHPGTHTQKNISGKTGRNQMKSRVWLKALY